jgi:hypothetical protein
MGAEGTKRDGDQRRNRAGNKKEAVHAMPEIKF